MAITINNPTNSLTEQEFERTLELGRALDIWKVEDGVISKHHVEKVKAVLRNWVLEGGKKSDCEKLIVILREGEYSEIADYLEYCIHLKETQNNEINDIPQLLYGTQYQKLPLDEFVQKSDPSFFAKYARAIFIFSIVFVILGIIAFISTLIISLNIPRSELHSDISSSVFTTILPNYLPKNKNNRTQQTAPFAPACVPSQMIRRNRGKLMHSNIVEPDWSEPKLDFCTNPETQLLIMDSETINQGLLPHLLCPERVTALEIYVNLSPFGFQQLFTNFCSITNVTFVGHDICFDEGMRLDESVPKVDARSLKFLEFQELFDCTNIFRLVQDSIYMQNLIAMHFKCVEFEDSDFFILNKMVKQSERFRYVSCEDRDGCKTLNFNSTLKMDIYTDSNKCEDEFAYGK